MTEKRPTLRTLNPILPVSDIEASVAFYVEQLGFEVAFRDASSDGTYVGVRRDGAELHLQWQRDEDMPRPGTIQVRFVVDDPDRSADEYRKRGVLDAGTAVSEKPWGTREFALRDPNGHVLIFYRDL